MEFYVRRRENDLNAYIKFHEKKEKFGTTARQAGECCNCNYDVFGN